MLPISERASKPELADELDALGRAFEQEAREIDARLLHTSVQQGTSGRQQYVGAREIAGAV